MKNIFNFAAGQILGGNVHFSGVTHNTDMGWHQLHQIKSFLIIIFILTFLLKAILPLTILSFTMAVVAGVFFCLSIHELNPLTRNIITLLLFGSGLLIWSAPGSFNWVQATIENAGLTTLLLTAPMMGTILYYAPYETVISSFANRYIRTHKMFYVMTMVLVTLLCPIMNSAAIPFAYQLLIPIAAKFSPVVFHRALVQGFTSNVFWAPNLGSMAVVLQYVHIAWQELLPVGIGFSALAFSVAYMGSKYSFSLGKSNENAQTEGTEESQPVTVDSDGRRYIMMLIVQVVLNLGVISMLTYYVNLTIYVAVAVVALFMPLLYALALGKVGIYRRRLAYYINNTLPGMNNEFVLFLGIGFFGYALAQSPTIAILQAQLAQISNFSPPVLALIMIVTIGSLAMIGIHPIITIASLAIALKNMEIGLSNVQLAMTLLAGYILYACLSPFSSVVMIMASLTGQNVYVMGLRLNARFALVLSLVVPLVIYVGRRFGY